MLGDTLRRIEFHPFSSDQMIRNLSMKKVRFGLRFSQIAVLKFLIIWSLLKG